MKKKYNFNQLEEYKKVKKAFTKVDNINYSKHKNIQFNFYKKSLANNRSNQSIVKLISNIGGYSIKRCLEYICKESDDRLLINNYGFKDNVDNILKSWKNDFNLKNNNSKDCWHMIFSIKEDMTKENIEKLENAVKKTMSENFFGYKYVFKIHTHQNNLHAHVVLNKRNQLTKKKIHFNNKEDFKDFWNDVRENFTCCLNLNNLNYHNLKSIENNLEVKYKKAINKLYSIDTRDNEDYKKRLFDILNNDISNNLKLLNSKNEKINNLKNNLDDLKKQRKKIMDLFVQYKNKNNKKYFKILKELKSINKDIKILQNDYLKSINDFH
ncbi:relaxase, partial [Campylobacter jejuni]|nr:relaxase [Campylobacter jejuni]